MTYAQIELNVHFARNSLRIKYSQPVNRMDIDRSTAASLELIQNIRPGSSKRFTLLGILNHTQTPQGHRLLRSTLLQPSTSSSEITDRHDAVEELSAEGELLANIRKNLKGLQQIDIERVMTWVRRQLMFLRIKTLD